MWHNLLNAYVHNWCIKIKSLEYSILEANTNNLGVCVVLSRMLNTISEIKTPIDNFAFSHSGIELEGGSVEATVPSRFFNFVYILVCYTFLVSIYFLNFIRYCILDIVYSI